MSAVFLILLLLPAGAGVCAVARCQLAEGLAVAMLGLVAAGYLLALAGLLPLLGLLPWAAALAGVILVERRRGDNPAFCRGLWQGAAAFVLLALFYWWLCRGHSLADWDDFSHWGRAAKWMFTTDTLYTVPGCDDGYKSYPPATALWQVMLLQAGRWVWRGFREDILLYANALLTAALLLVPLRAAGLCLLFPLGPSADKVRYAPQEAAASGADRVLSRHAADRIRALGETAPRLWLITANDGGAAELRIRYDLLPLQLPAHAVILMADVPEGLIWAREISPEDWSRDLAESYDYVYIYCPEDQFVADYLSVFEPGSQSEVVNDRMFRVIRQGDGSAKLRCIDGVAAQPVKNAE